MIKFIVSLGLVGFLFTTNPTMEDAAKEAKRRVEEEQSGMRAGWSSVSKVTGLNWLSKQAGAGNYEFCRKDLYIASFYRIKNAKLLDSTKPVAVMVGAASKVWGWRISSEGEQSSFLLEKLGSIAESISFAECTDFHNSGEMSMG